MRCVAHAETEMGSIDILINNSGVSTTQRIQDVTEDDYDFIFNTNVRGSMLMSFWPCSVCQWWWLISVSM